MYREINPEQNQLYSGYSKKKKTKLYEGCSFSVLQLLNTFRGTDMETGTMASPNVNANRATSHCITSTALFGNMQAPEWGLDDVYNSPKRLHVI